MIDNTKNTQISVFDIKIKRIFVANNVLLNNTIMKKLLLLAFVLCILYCAGHKKNELF